MLCKVEAVESPLTEISPRIKHMVNVFILLLFCCCMRITAFCSHNYLSAYPLTPILLTPCPSYSFPSVFPSFHYLPSAILLPLLVSSVPSSSVLATPSIIPTQGELEAIQAQSLESQLGDFQPHSPGFTLGLWAWELAAQGGYCRGEINHTWQLLCKSHTHTLTHTEPHILSI